MTTYVTVDVTWTFKTDPEDARLILKALGGRLKESEIEAAKKLGDNLTLQRAKAAKTISDQMIGHAGKVET